MSLEETQRTIDHYFDLMSRGGDFAQCYTDDVTWTTIDIGDEVRGTPKREGPSSPTGTHI
jgi:ketosteroid isomerase-like protein